MVYFARKINFYSFCEKSSYERVKNDKIFALLVLRQVLKLLK